MNYRLIALLDLEAKVYARCLLKALEEWVAENNILPYFQTGFRASASTIDNITALAILSHQAAQRSQLPLFCCFMDYSAAFDKVSRNTLWRTLDKWGIPGSLLGALISLHKTHGCELEQTPRLSLQKSLHQTV